MAWVKLDDAMPSHPKVLASGPLGFALDVAAICYSNAHDTDGFIPAVALPAVLPGLPTPRKHAKALVDAGRWHEVDGGWRIHDIDEYQFSREEQAERARKKREKAALGNHKRWHVGRGQVDPDCPLCESLDDPSGIAGRSPDDHTEESPEIPRPDPTPISNDIESEEASDVARLCEVLADAVEAHGKVGRPQIKPRWHEDMRLLLSRGPTDVEPTPVEPERVERAIRVVFSQFAVPDPGSSFCWADQVRSPGALRKHWTAIRLAAKSAAAVRAQATEWVDPHEVSA